MPNTYTQIYIHLVFAVQGRHNIINNTIKEELQKYTTGILENRKQKLYAINIMPDHCHIFFSMTPTINISDLVKDIKTGITNHINKNHLLLTKFEWQKGFGAFSYAHSQIDNVVKYIQNQEEHHKKHTFREEYIDFLKKFNVDYNPNYLFEFYEDEIK
ncbi:MAG: IS200/IS605 family transposase [Bacteroidetes bacterium]|nr:IS200/IS605 family transposase [Bacteroidota bacterium]